MKGGRPGLPSWRYARIGTTLISGIWPISSNRPRQCIAVVADTPTVGSLNHYYAGVVINGDHADWDVGK
jgi:hypothetical protein